MPKRSRKPRALVEIRSLRFSRGTRVIFDGINMDIPDGRVTAVDLVDRGVVQGEEQRIFISIDALGTYTARCPVEGVIKDLNTLAADRVVDYRTNALWVQTDEGDDVILQFHGYRLGFAPSAFVRYGERIGQGQRSFAGSHIAADDLQVGILLLHQADGFEYAERLSDPKDMDRVVREWLEFPGPAFLEVIIDPDAGVYPMVGPGMSYDKMITGDWIESRDAPVEDQPGPSEMF